MFPALVNCTTIDWFSEWPLDALLEVADKYLNDMTLGSEEEVGSMSFAKCQQSYILCCVCCIILQFVMLSSF